VQVREGRVLVRAGEQSRFLGAGDSWTSLGDAPAARPPAMSEPTMAEPTMSEPTPEPIVVPQPEPGPPQRARPRGHRPSAPSELGAQNRLLEAAELAQKSGLPMLAVQRLEALIARYPDAELAHNARVERFRLLDLAGRHGEAAAAARDYLERHPDGFARGEAERLLAGPAVP
jgi:hypothetical protein